MGVNQALVNVDVPRETARAGGSGKRFLAPPAHPDYLARFQTWVFLPPPPMDGAGLMTLSSSPVMVMGRFWS